MFVSVGLHKTTMFECCTRTCRCYDVMSFFNLIRLTTSDLNVNYSQEAEGGANITAHLKDPHRTALEECHSRSLS